MAKTGIEETRATARLPNLDIEIAHRRYPDGEALMVSLRATPSFDAVSRWLEASSPFLFWAKAMEAAWAPWLGVMAPRRTLRDERRG